MNGLNHGSLQRIDGKGLISPRPQSCMVDINGMRYEAEYSVSLGIVSIEKINGISAALMSPEMEKIIVQQVEISLIEEERNNECQNQMMSPL